MQSLKRLFSLEELVNGNPSGTTNLSKEPQRKSIQKLDPARMNYINYDCFTTTYTHVTDLPMDLLCIDYIESPSWEV